MRITRDVPKAGTTRVRKVFALLPMFFDHGSNNEPKRTMIWFDYYFVQEHYSYGSWEFSRRYIDE